MMHAGKPDEKDADRLAPSVVFDGHNDVLTRLQAHGGRDVATSFLTGRDGAIDLPRARRGNFGGGFFAVYVPSPVDSDLKFEEMTKATYDLPLPEPIKLETAIPIALSQVALLLELQRLGALRVCVTVSDIRKALNDGIIAAILHIEGAEAIDPDFHMLDVLHAAGMRSLGPVWSRPTRFGDGVPFRFPATPNIGAGLTALGRDLVRRCNTLGILVDLSHLNEAGFWDVSEVSDAPLVATHSNVHAICPHARNLTDDQLRAIAESNGMVGLNFAAAFLRADGQMKADVSLDQMLRHIDYLLETLGEDGVGLGSDYDGAVVPRDLTGVENLPRLIAAMRSHGYDDPLLRKICHENWLRVLGATWNA